MHQCLCLQAQTSRIFPRREGNTIRGRFNLGVYPIRSTFYTAGKCFSWMIFFTKRVTTHPNTQALCMSDRLIANCKRFFERSRSDLRNCETTFRQFCIAILYNGCQWLFFTSSSSLSGGLSVDSSIVVQVQGKLFCASLLYKMLTSLIV